MTTAPEAENEDAVPLGESIANTRRRVEGEDPEEREDDGETDAAPRMRGSKPSPLGAPIKRCASRPAEKDDEPEPPKKKPATTLAKPKSPAHR